MRTTPDPPDAGLSCEGITVRLGDAVILRRLSLHVPAGSRAVLVGPSGAGKTTLLRAVAGLEPLEEGEVRVDGRPLAGVPAHRRKIAVVFQEPRLLPHLEVIDNVAFPLRAAGVRRSERRARARVLLDEVGLGGFAGRPTRGLSGGEQQRVALARALCAEPGLLLLDEPLAALDPNRREGLLALIVRLQRERSLTTLAVTHDQAEAAQLGQRLALMLEGRIVQYDEPGALFERPITAAVARFFGVANLLRGVVHDGALTVGGHPIAVPGPDGPATVAIRPEHVRLDPDGSLRGRVVESVYAGAHVRLRLDCGGQALEVQVAPHQAPRAGERVGVKLPAESLWRLPGEDEAVEIGAGAG
ncbi:MAG: ABC transporter ATP-binding protein [Solirubrobacteraceae bacterium]